MKDNRRWMSLAMLVAFALVLALMVAQGRQAHVATIAHTGANQTLWCLSDGCFVVGVLFAGFGAMLWVATTGFFDIFSYAVRNLLMLFTPLRSPKETKHFIDYKTERAEKRKPVKPEMFFVGVGFLLAAAVLMMLIG